MNQSFSDSISPTLANQYLSKWREGDKQAYNRLIEILHNDLRRIAHRQFGRERVNHTLQTDDLISKLYIKLLTTNTPEWKDHAHFLNSAARAMRQILIDHARGWQRRADGKGRVAMDDRDEGIIGAQSGEYMEKLVLLDQVIGKLEQTDPNMARIADLKLVLGLTLAEIAEELEMDLSKVKREWVLIKKILTQKMGPAT